MSLRKALIALSFVLVPPPAAARDVTIGIAAPLEGPYSLVARQMVAGANAAAARSGSKLTVAEEGCTPEGGIAAANIFIGAKVDAVTGFACLESLNAALPFLSKANIPVLTTGVRADTVIGQKPKTGFSVWRLGPADHMEAEALAAALLDRWAATPFAVIDDGTVHARDLAESLRAAAMEKGFKPVFFDTFRPGLDNQSALARRLSKAGAKAIFMGGDIEDALVLDRNAKDLGFAFEIALGETAVPSENPFQTVLTLVLPDYATVPEARQAVADLGKAGIEAENVALTAHAAVEILVEALKSGTGIGTASYKTAIGEVSFEPSGEPTGNPWTLKPVRAQNSAAKP